jgi:MFS family permease
MESIQLTTREFLIYAILIGAALGALFGLVPLILGIRRDNRRMGLYGFVASIVAGAFAPLLSIIIVAIFAWLIVKKKDAAPSSDNADTGDSETSST